MDEDKTIDLLWFVDSSNDKKQEMDLDELELKMQRF